MMVSHSPSCSGISSDRLASGFAHNSRFVKRTLLAGVVAAALAGPCFAQTVSPRRLVEVADLAGPVVSPDGRSVAFRVERASIERNTYDAVWYVQGLDGASPPRRVADGGVPLRDSAGGSVPAMAVWSPDGRWIYYRALLDGAVDVWRAAADGSGAEPVTLDPADVRDFSLSADGGTLTYSVGATRDAVVAAEQAEYDHGVHIDENVPLGQNLFRGGRVGGRPATQRYGGTWFDLAPLLADVPDVWKAVNLATRRRSTLAPADHPAPQPTPLSEGAPEPWKRALEPAGDRIATLARADPAEGFLESQDVRLALSPGGEAGRSVPCTAEPCRGKPITGIQWRPGGDEVLFTVTDPDEGFAQSIFRWNIRSGEVLSVARADGLMSGGRDRFSSCGLSADALACVVASAHQPPRLERIDLETGDRHVLFEPNAALALDLAETTPSRMLRWSDASGQTFTGRFFPARGTGNGPPPLFVTYYSCQGFLRGGLGDEWPLASLAELGVSALCINSAPYRVNAVERYEQGLSAVASVVDLLASEGEIDRARVGMGGLSFGSEVTLWTAIYSDLLTAASVASPLLSPTYHLLGSLKEEAFFAGLEKNWQVGAPNETPEQWRVLSPVFNLDRIEAPILMQMAEQEYIHSLDYAVPLIRDDRADLYVFPHEAHQKFQPRHKLAVYERNLDWFRFWLQGYVDPDPRKAEQYRRWEDMRERRNAAQDPADDDSRTRSPTN